MGKKNIYNLWEFLSHRQHLCKHVERLSLKPAYMCPTDMREYALQWRDWVLKAAIDSQYLVLILDLLPSLRVLTLTDIVTTSPKRAAPRIGRLDLERSMRTSGDILRTLSLFTDIQHLRIIFPEGTLGPASLPEMALRSARIESLHVQGDFPWTSFTNALRSSMCLTSLREVSLGPISSQPTLWGMRHFTALFAPVLVSLKCELSVHQTTFTGLFGEQSTMHNYVMDAKHVPADDYLQLFEGCQWTRLDDITIRFRTRISIGRYSGVQYNHGVWAWVATLINSLSSCTVLRRVTLELLDFVSDTELRRAIAGLRDIERNIVQLQRVNELRVVMDPSYPPLNSAQREVVTTAMPDLHHAGILRF